MATEEHGMKEGEVGQYWLAEQLEVGLGYGIRWGEDHFTDTVLLRIQVHDADWTGHFALPIDMAEALGTTLLMAVRDARAGVTLGEAND